MAYAQVVIVFSVIAGLTRNPPNDGLCFTMFCALGYAQDIIITENAEKIEAKVLEVNMSSIKYKKFFNQDGPIYTISKIEVYAIVYENGTVDEFAANSHGVKAIHEFDQMSDWEQEKFLQETDLPIYETFYRGRLLRDSASGLLGFGLLFSSIGAGIVILNAADVLPSGALVGEIIIGAGQVLIIGSIPLSATGGALKKRAQNNFRNKYSGYGALEPTLNLNFNGNGVGLSINF